MSEVVEIRFKVNGEFTPWEPEHIRTRALGATPTAVQRITELRNRFPAAAISVERRGEPKPERSTQMFRFSFYVREGSMTVHDPNGVNGVSVTRIENQTLFSRPFADAEREMVRAAILREFPKADLVEVKA